MGTFLRPGFDSQFDLYFFILLHQYRNWNWTLEFLFDLSSALLAQHKERNSSVSAPKRVEGKPGSSLSVGAMQPD